MKSPSGGEKERICFHRARYFSHVRVSTKPVLQGLLALAFVLFFVFLFCNVKWAQKMAFKVQSTISSSINAAMYKKHYLTFPFKGSHIYSLSLIFRT